MEGAPGRLLEPFGRDLPPGTGGDWTGWICWTEYSVLDSVRGGGHRSVGWLRRPGFADAGRRDIGCSVDVVGYIGAALWGWRQYIQVGAALLGFSISEGEREACSCFAGLDRLVHTGGRSGRRLWRWWMR
jgi:hypothetical protein